MWRKLGINQQAILNHGSNLLSFVGGFIWAQDLVHLEVKFCPRCFLHLSQLFQGDWLLAHRCVSQWLPIIGQDAQIFFYFSLLLLHFDFHSRLQQWILFPLLQAFLINQSLISCHCWKWIYLFYFGVNDSSLCGIALAAIIFDDVRCIKVIAFFLRRPREHILESEIFGE